ncbi:MAG: hypothetical protein HZA89_01755 [Verrucomicrobia bacterium]|nr:hypothetical protein [Verrucomicrobiota bacterium]
MKKLTLLLTVGVLGATMLAARAADRPLRDDTSGTDDSTRVRPPAPEDRRGRDGKVVDRPTPRPERPDGVERPTLPAEVKALMEKFETAREEFMKEQREIEKQLKGATEEEREKIREQLKTKREEWLEKTKELREEIKKRIDELKDDKLKDRPQVLDAAKQGDQKRGRSRD